MPRAKTTLRATLTTSNAKRQYPVLQLQTLVLSRSIIRMVCQEVRPDPRNPARDPAISAA